MEAKSRKFEPATSPSLLQQVRRLDQSAWRCFVEIYGPMIYSRCRSFGLPTSDCADLTQDVLTKLLQNLDKFPVVNSATHNAAEEGDSSAQTLPAFRRWLRTITANTVRDSLKRKQPRFVQWDQEHLEAVSASFLTESVNISGQVPADTISLHFPRAQSKRTSTIAGAVRARPQGIKKKNWQAFWRTTIEGSPDAVVAEELGMTTKAVRQARYETIRELREELSGLVDFEDPDDTPDSSGAVSFQ